MDKLGGSRQPWWATWLLAGTVIMMVRCSDPVSQAIDAATADPPPVGTVTVSPGKEMGLQGWTMVYDCARQPDAVTVAAYGEAGCQVTGAIPPADWTVPAEPVAPATDTRGGLPWALILIVLGVVAMIVGAVWFAVSRAQSRETAGGRSAVPDAHPDGGMIS